MESDPIERQLPWLTPWFTASSYSGKDFNNQDYVIADAISASWMTTLKVDLFDSLGNKYGRDKVAGVIDKIVAAHIKPEWEATARNLPRNNLDDFIRLLWEPLPNQGFNVIIKKQLNGVQIHCVRCPHAELGRQINGSYWLYHLVCSGDEHAAAGFNPCIGFRRSQTLMQGNPCCDHFYYVIE